MFDQFKQCKHALPKLVPQGVKEDLTLPKEHDVRGVHEYCLKGGLYGGMPERKIANLDNKTARRLRKCKLKIGCRQAAKLMLKWLLEH